MRAIVDGDACNGCGLCVYMRPDVFNLDEDVAISRVSLVPHESRSLCRDAMEGCPTDAISIEE